MDESDSNSSVERVFERYSQNFKYFSRVETESIPCFTGAVVETPAAKSQKKKLTKSADKRNRKKNKTRKQETSLNLDRGETSDPDYVPTRNYAKMTSRQLNNIATRVRIYHETGVIVPDDENIIPCRFKKAKPKKNGTNVMIENREPNRTTHCGKGNIGVGPSSYGVRKCACCNKNKQDCVNNLLHNSPEGNAAASLGLSNNNYADIFRKLSTGGINRFKQREERLLQVQQRELLQHPEITEVTDENSVDDEPPLRPSVLLSHDKRQWIKKFIDSMASDRVDYEKPQQRKIVEGINHSPADDDSVLLQQILDKHAPNTKTIIQRIDFKKEKERRSRLGQTKLDDWLKLKSTSTPNFNSTELDQTSGVSGSASINIARLSPIQRISRPWDPFNISGIEKFESNTEVPMANTKEVDNNVPATKVVGVINDVARKTDERNLNEVAETNIADHDYVDISHLDRSNITIRAPPSGRKEIKPPVISEDSKECKSEDGIMDFVNNLLAGQEESIHQEVEERCERILEVRRQTHNIFDAAFEQYNHLYNNDGLDDSVQIIEDLNDRELNNSATVIVDDENDDVQIIDGPSTSKRTWRGIRNKRKARIKANTTKATKPVPLPSVSESVQPKPSQEDEEKKPIRSLRDCPICLDPIVANKDISSTICGHIFCTSCIVAAVRSSRSCPNCRTKLTLKKIHPLFI